MGLHHMQNSRDLARSLRLLYRHLKAAYRQKLQCQSIRLNNIASDFILPRAVIIRLGYIHAYPWSPCLSLSTFPPMRLLYERTV